jgi:APA family basic amino acid/polyamine antiporter
MSAAREPGPELVKGLGAWDATLITIGSILGTGIFITTGDIARVLPHAGLILLAWVMGGVLTLAGALTYAELGTMFPRAGGQYHFLREAYGPLWGFLFGWTAFLVIMTGGIATMAVGFGEYLGSFLPFFSTSNALLALPLGPWTWSLSGGQLAGALAIVVLSAVNYVGLKEGAGLQNLVTAVKVGSIVGFGCLGLWVPAQAELELAAAVPSGGVLAAFGVAMIAVSWSFDGWYGVTNVGEEMRRPERDLPRGLIGGTLVVTLLYVLMNLVYLRALPVSAMAETGRVAEGAATALLGTIGGRVMSAAVLVSSFGCISSTILYAARVYLPMARDGVFFPALAAIHPRYLTPAACIAAQGAWAVLLTCSGSYEQLYTYTMFAVMAAHAATGAAVFVLRRTRPQAARAYRVQGYPLVPAVFVLASIALLLNTVFEKPLQSLAGAGIVCLGAPAYAWWSSRVRRAPGPRAGRAAGGDPA